MGIVGIFASLGILATNIFLSRRNNKKNLEQNRIIAERREAMERAIRENQRERAMRIMREGQELTLELERKRHAESLKELTNQFEDHLKSKAYEMAMVNWPLKTLPIVMMNQAYGNLITHPNENVALHCILVPSNNRDFNFKVFPTVESEVEQYCNVNWSSIGKKPVLFYSGAWNGDVVNNNIQIKSLRNTLSNLPTLVIRPYFRPTDKKLVFNIDMWGFDGDDLSQEMEPTDEMFQRDYKSTDNWAKDANLVDDAVEDLVPYLKCAIGVMADTYFWSVFGMAPSFPTMLTDGTINVDGMRNLQHSALDYYDDLLRKGEDELQKNPFIENRLLTLLEGCYPLADDVINREKLKQLFLTCYSVRTGHSPRKVLASDLEAKTCVPMKIIDGLTGENNDLSLNYVVSLMMINNKVRINDAISILFDLQSRLEEIIKNDSASTNTYSLNVNLPVKVGGVTFNMKQVKAGDFMMGFSESDPEKQEYATPQHKVTLTKDYYIGETVVTQALWREVMGSLPKDCTGEYAGDNKPVVCVSWENCVEFIRKLNVRTEGKYGTFRLPTEAEWEYAARGGHRWREHEFKYSGRDNLDEVGWYGRNSGGKLHDVMEKKEGANAIGLYDMSGNVWEWCEDWYIGYNGSDQTDPKGPSSGSYRVYRGGSWGFDAAHCRVAYRNNGAPDCGGSALGFRLVLSKLQP